MVESSSLVSQGTPQRVCLHVGCGLRNPASLHPMFRGADWREVRIDIDPQVEPDIVASITNMPMIATASVHAVWSSHNLEHLYSHEVQFALNEFYRVLNAQGIVVITLPDLQKVAELVAADQLEDVAYLSPAGPITPLDILYGHSASIRAGKHFMAHRTGFTARSLSDSLARAGFEKIQVRRAELNLWAKAQKPQTFSPSSATPAVSDSQLLSAAARLARAIEQHSTGHLADAEELYRQLLDENPANADARHLLGLVAHQSGRSDQAVELVRQAIAINPASETYHLNLGGIYLDLARLEEAVACFTQALHIKPDLAEAYYNLASAQRRLGRLAEAVRSGREALRLKPVNAMACNCLGVALQEQGQLAEAQAQFERAVQLDPEFADGYFNLGNVLRLQRRFDEAVQHCQHACHLRPQSSPSYSNLGAALQEADRLDEASAAFQQALQLDPDNVEALANLAALRLAQRRPDEAIGYSRRALALKPGFAVAWMHLGNANQAQGRHEEAIDHFRRAIELAPRHAAAYCSLAGALRSVRRNDESLTVCRQALEFEPENVELWSQLGATWLDLENQAEAVASYREALRLAPNLADAHRNLANALRSQGQLDEAIACCQRALELKPDLAMAHNTLGFCLFEKGQLTEALGKFSDCLRYQPDNANAHNNLAAVQRELGQFAAALANLETAVAIDPLDAIAHRNRAMFWLQAGDFDRGWTEYEWRWRCRKRPHFGPQPQWDGAEFPGRVLLLYTEQGLGDVLQFVRYAPLVKQRGGTVLLVCEPPLARLLASCAGLDGIMSGRDPLPPFDLQFPLMSLPGIFRTDLKTIPATVPYLAPPDDCVKRWSQELGDTAVFKVGIAWQGSPLHNDDRKRSIPLGIVAQLAAVPGVRLYSLQTGEARHQLGNLPAEPPIDDLGGRVEDFADTAAVMRNLDLVISCDSAAVHLAGALGVPVWAALPFAPDWRWLLERADSPWYPTMRLFRQQQAGDWQGVFAAMAEELKGLVSRR